MFYTKWGKGGVGDYLFFVFLPWSLGSLALNSNLNWVHSFILWTSSYSTQSQTYFNYSLTCLHMINEILGLSCLKLVDAWLVFNILFITKTPASESDDLM